jgi:hypothetical protein
LLYWYESTNTDAHVRASLQLLGLRVARS